MQRDATIFERKLRKIKKKMAWRRTLWNFYKNISSNVLYWIMFLLATILYVIVLKGTGLAFIIGWAIGTLLCIFLEFKKNLS